MRVARDDRLDVSPFLRQPMTTFIGIVHTPDFEQLNEFFRTGLEVSYGRKSQGKVGVTF